jgi:hypothetical protein
VIGWLQAACRCLVLDGGPGRGEGQGRNPGVPSTSFGLDVARYFVYILGALLSISETNSQNHV